ncbi:hypothetical protein PROFUN_13567 [Planoprotostelium fungivorum]|uniref:SURP motif domain-containing protein n=1 Tax=Planoprotostelium fungivorum TaxID=1890364 RepID=A0A2P6N3I2_9EUKA|nr:hypothetical protein PROFUN_13567 [Planoprotostelium fungivorum]
MDRFILTTTVTCSTPFAVSVCLTELKPLQCDGFVITTSISPLTAKNARFLITMKPKRKEKRKRIRDEVPVENHLRAIGYPSTIKIDAKMGSSMDNGSQLVKWLSTDVHRLIDRYDVRNLLDDIRLFAPPSRRKKEDTANTSLYALRWNDLLNPEQDEEEEREEEGKEIEEEQVDTEQVEAAKRASLDPNAFHQVSFTYEAPKEEKEEGQRETTGEDYELKFPVPRGVETPRKKLHFDIMWRTVKFVRDKGADQVELSLRIRHSNNPNFNFLWDKSPLHPFYKHLKDNYSSISLWMTMEKEQEATEETKETEDKKDIPSHILKPPEDVMQLIDKTVGSLSTRDADFVKVVCERAKYNPKMSFLKPEHPYHPYYLFKRDKTAEQMMENNRKEDEREMTKRKEESEAEEKRKEEESEEKKRREEEEREKAAEDKRMMRLKRAKLAMAMLGQKSDE